MRFLKEEIKVIKEKDPALKSSLEIILYPSFWAVLMHRISHRLYKRGHYLSARLISQLMRFFTGIEIHPGAKIGKNFFIDHGMGVVIGETCEIGDNVLIYQGVTLGGTGKETGKRHPTIRDNVLIGAGAKILGPFTVGENARIGAGSVVLAEVPPDSTVVGIPGKVMQRKHQLICPADCLEQRKLPDPVQMDLCKIRNRMDEVEGKLQQMEASLSGREAGYKANIIKEGDE